MMKKISKMLVLMAVLTVATAACEMEDSADATSSEETASMSEEEVMGVVSYNSISQQEAKELMESTDCIILDVRTEEEYEESHIPNAICVPNEIISGDQGQIISELPDKEQTILVYCRSGRRSKEAAQKLVAMGYTDIREFGGIIDWDGELER